MQIKSILKFLFMSLLLPSSVIYSQAEEITAVKSISKISNAGSIMTGYAVNSAGKIIYKTTDGGKTWLNQLVPSLKQIKPIAGVKKSTGSIQKREVTNEEGLIAGKPLTQVQTQSKTGGFMPADDYINSAGGLAGIIIGFTLQYPGFVSIKIYDKSGNTIDELARSSFGSGSHRVKWNPEKIKAEGYFYSIVTSEFSETKKINLTK
jgi:hypothetical protein